METSKYLETDLLLQGDTEPPIDLPVIHNHSIRLSGIHFCRVPENPEVLYFAPRQGSEGTLVCFHLQSASLLVTTNRWTHIIFHTVCSPGEIMYLGFWNSNYQYALSADTPMISTCLGDMVSIPLWVIVYSIADLVPYTLYAGEFSYCQEQGRGRATSPKEILLNRSSLGIYSMTQDTLKTTS